MAKQENTKQRVSVPNQLRVAADYMDGILLKEIVARYNLRNIHQATRIAYACGAKPRRTNYVELLTRKKKSTVPRGRPFKSSAQKEREANGDQSSSAH